MSHRLLKMCAKNDTSSWCHIALVMDCASREALGWRLSKRGNAATAEAALEEALIHRFGHLGRVPGPLQLRSDNGLVFTSARYTDGEGNAYWLAQLESGQISIEALYEDFYRSEEAQIKFVGVIDADVSLG